MYSRKDKQDILLESGTNEVEVAEINICGYNFGVNVAKIREFLPFKTIELTRLPGMHPSVDGVFILRGHAIPLINLQRHLNLKRRGEDPPNKVVVVTEFNNMTTAFVADTINRIHRVSWDQFRPLSLPMGTDAPTLVGSVQLEDHELLILDLEHIVGEIFPNSIINYDEKRFAGMSKPEQRREIKLVFAEDSGIIRYRVSGILKEVGYENLKIFEHGKAAYDYLRQLAQEGRIAEEVDLVLTDIEMPQMDGLTLCRRIREELKLDLPVIIFSSLINEQMRRKCLSVGANDVVAKPNTEQLIATLDKFCLGKGGGKAEASADPF